MLIKLLLVLLLVIPKMLSAKMLDIIVNVPFTTPENSRIFFTSDLAALCSWKADCLEMKDIGLGSFRVVVSLPENVKKIHFKITRGSWETEAADSYSMAYRDIVVDLTNNSSSPVVQNIIHWKDLAPLYKVASVLGPYSFYSTDLEVNKDISIYLPPNYDQTNKSYPVIYMHDGQNVFDPTTSTFGVKWAIDETMNTLINNKKVREAIIVAIHTNNKDRWTEYDYYLRGKKYSNFIANDVIPFVEKNFRVTPHKNARFLMGSSMGALISLMMVIDRSDLFSRAAGVSFPAFIDARAIFRFLDEKKTLPDFSFYMDHGNWGIDSRYAPSALELFKTLLNKGMTSDHLLYNVFPYADHTEADWARRAYIPLEFLLKNN